MGSVLCVREHGPREYVARLASRLGKVVEYGDYRYREPEEIREILCGDAGD